MARPRLLAVGDDAVTERLFAALDHQVVDLAPARDWASALAQLALARSGGGPYDLVIVWHQLYSPAIPRDLRARQLDPHLVILCPDPLSASRLEGADDIIVEPASRGELLARLERATRWRDADAASTPAVAARKPRKSDVIIGGGEWIKELYDKLSMAAPTDVTMTISGASGTGKELVARTVHSLSRRYQGPFVTVNCAAIPEALLEDELFGHVRGAFTDAAQDREGLFADADGGTIFLDEIGELPLALQGKLLRVLQTQEFRRIGDNQVRKVDVRILAATNRDLASRVASGEFREDLYYRINVFPLHLPPLRERREDIPLLAHHFLRVHRRSVGKLVSGFTDEALARLSSYPFPGNVRELENRVHRALVMARGELIEARDLDLPETRATRAGLIDLDRPFRELKDEAVAEFEREYLRKLLTMHRGNLAAAARAAGIDRKNLWSMAKKRGVDVDDYRNR